MSVAHQQGSNLLSRSVARCPAASPSVNSINQKPPLPPLNLRAGPTDWSWYTCAKLPGCHAGLPNCTVTESEEHGHKVFVNTNQWKDPRIPSAL